MKTDKKPRAIFLCHRIPYPPDKGDKIRSYHILKYLTDRYDVSLGCFIDDPTDMQHRKILDNLCAETFYRQINPSRSKAKSLMGLFSGEPLSFRAYQDRAMDAWVREQRTKRPSVEVAFSAQVAPYLQGASVPTLIDFCDADSAKFEAYSHEGNFLSRTVYAREAKLLRMREAEIARWSTKTFLVSPEEARLVRERPGVPADKIDWFRNGVDVDYWRADANFTRLSPGYDIVFTGAMDYRPNIEAVSWFADNVWPKLIAIHPSMTFGVVGARPTSAIVELGTRPGITVTGRVPDIRPYLAAAKVAVAPLKIARGIQNKVLEAMAMGVPMVASTGAIAGTAAIDGTHLLAADTPQEMVTAIQSLMADPERAIALGKAATGYIREQFRWKDTLARFGAALPADEQGPSVDRHLGLAHT